MDIREEVRKNAISAIGYFEDEIVRKIIDSWGLAVPEALREYSDDYQFRSGIRGPVEAVQLIEELSDYEGEAYGADWKESWRQGLQYLAEDTYQNAVVAEFENQMGFLNGRLESLEWGLPTIKPEPPPTRRSGVMNWLPDAEAKYQEDLSNYEDELRHYEQKQQAYRERILSRMENKVRKVIKDFVTKKGG